MIIKNGESFLKTLDMIFKVSRAAYPCQNALSGKWGGRFSWRFIIWLKMYKARLERFSIGRFEFGLFWIRFSQMWRWSPNFSVWLTIPAGRRAESCLWSQTSLLESQMFDQITVRDSTTDALHYWSKCGV